MRTTIDLPEDLHRILLHLASHQRGSLSTTAADLIWRGLLTPPGKPVGEAGVSISPATGLPVLRLSRPVTAEDVRSIEDDS